jgi:glycosyltransferase involved in cell wall biosynthesis
MMHNLPNISIAIPAYNEEKNIGELLRQIFVQRVRKGIVSEVLVVSDGSTDRTVDVVRSFSDPRLKLVDRRERIGLSSTQNEIVALVTGDILLMLNGDILLGSDRFVDDMITPLLEDNLVGIVGAATASLPPRTWLESVVAFSHQFKTHIYEHANGGDSIHLCHGRARAFSRRIFSRIAWPGLCPEDSFSYLFCLSSGYKFRYAENVRISFRSPTTLRDYARQSRRFARGKRLLQNYFDARWVRRVHAIPLMVIFRSTVRFFANNPIQMVAYGFVFLYSHYFLNEGAPNDVVYEISPSTKKLT